MLDTWRNGGQNSARCLGLNTNHGSVGPSPASGLSPNPERKPDMPTCPPRPGAPPFLCQKPSIQLVFHHGIRLLILFPPDPGRLVCSLTMRSKAVSIANYWTFLVTCGQGLHCYRVQEAMHKAAAAVGTGVKTSPSAVLSIVVEQVHFFVMACLNSLLMPIWLWMAGDRLLRYASESEPSVPLNY